MATKGRIAERPASGESQGHDRWEGLSCFHVSAGLVPPARERSLAWEVPPLSRGHDRTLAVASGRRGACRARASWRAGDDLREAFSRACGGG